MQISHGVSTVISFGPFVDATDGVTLETGLVSALDHGSTGIKLSKNGAALTIRHATVTATTYDGYGNYRVTLDPTDTNTLGKLRMQFVEPATCRAVWQDFDVVPLVVSGSVTSSPAVDSFVASMPSKLGTLPEDPEDAAYEDFCVQQSCLFTTGLLAGEARPITAYDSGTTTISVLPSFTVAPSVGDKFVLLPTLTHFGTLLDGAAGVETSRTVRQALRLMLSALCGKVSGAGSHTPIFRDTNDTKARITAITDSNGNRSSVTLDGT